jgi:hypothetical protein
MNNDNTEAVTRKERLAAAEAEILAYLQRQAEGDAALLELHDKALYKELGFATWDAYVKKGFLKRYELTRAQINARLWDARVRAMLPPRPDGRPWSHGELREFVRTMTADPTDKEEDEAGDEQESLTPAEREGEKL